jgi:hypothetical protein
MYEGGEDMLMRRPGAATRRLLMATAGAAAIIGLVAVPASGAGAAASADSPAGFWYGTDSATVTVTGSAPYQEPVVGGTYGGYMGMIGDWAKSEGCANYKLAWSATNAAQANTNLTQHADGVGAGAYWFMGGPGVDPHYNGTSAEAYAWGERQGAWAVSAIHANVANVKYPVVFMDVEMPGSKVFDPATDNGWNDVYTSSCSGRAKATYIPASVDRADLNGFSYYLVHHSSRKVGVYSARSVWAAIFGTGTAATLSGVYEWTYLGDTSSLSHHPAGWCLAGTSTCAQWFGGVTSSSAYALMWQWSGGGGTYNGHGDFDQIDAKTIH